MELAVENGQVGIGRDYVNAVRLDLHPVFRLDDRHLGMPRRSSGIMPLCVGSRCWTRTKAVIPVAGDRREKGRWKAPSPPADAPMPTM